VGAARGATERGPVTHVRARGACRMKYEGGFVSNWGLALFFLVLLFPSVQVASNSAALSISNARACFATQRARRTV